MNLIFVVLAALVLALALIGIALAAAVSRRDD